MGSRVYELGRDQENGCSIGISLYRGFVTARDLQKRKALAGSSGKFVTLGVRYTNVSSYREYSKELDFNS